MNKPIYLDYAATTPVDERVADKMFKYLTMDGVFANPASRSHMYGWQAEAAVEQARKQVANLLNADTREIVWTSGATEANNLAIKGAMTARHTHGKHLITSMSEHKAVIDSVKYLESDGYEVTWLKPRENGAIAVEDVAEAIREDTVLISLMHVNNETGVINDVLEISRLAESKGILFHIDAAQSTGKLEIDTQVLRADMISMSAHKIYGPKGIGALYVRRNPGFDLPAQIHGGGHERGMRSGTLPTHQIVAMGEAFEIASSCMTDEQKKLKDFKFEFLKRVLAQESVKLNGSREQSVPGIVNLSFDNIDGQVLLSALPQLAISSGSACTSASMSPSHVLSSMGISDELALSALRFSFGRYTKKEEVLGAAELLVSAIEKMQG